MESIRSFIAIELPEEFKAELTSVEGRLKSSCYPFVKWVNPSGIHLTLKFLGNIRAEETTNITDSLTDVAHRASPFQLGFGELGAFPNLKRPRVVWVGMKGDTEKLAALQREIESALAPLGFPAELHRFTPHLTLARLREGILPIERENFGKLVASTTFRSKLVFEVDAVNLMRSQLSSTGAIYNQLAVIALGKGGNQREG